MFMLTVHMTITLLIEDSPYGFIAFMHENYPQRVCNSLRFNKLTLSSKQLGIFLTSLSVQRYKNESKWQNKFLFIFTLPSAITLCKGRKKSDSQKKNRFFYDTWTMFTTFRTPLACNRTRSYACQSKNTYWSARNATKGCYENEDEDEDYKLDDN